MDDIKRSETRARAVVRRLIQAGGLDHMLTLTYRENQTDVGQCANDLSRFLRLVRQHIPGYKYVAVFERQKRGAGHWHLAVAGWQNVTLLRALWRQVVGQGNIDVRAVRGSGSGDTSAKLAAYLSKYITKTLGDQTELAHRYRRSHNIRIDERVEEYEDGNLARVAEDIFRRFPGGGPNCYIQTDLHAEAFIWACSWGGTPKQQSSAHTARDSADS